MSTHKPVPNFSGQTGQASTDNGSAETLQNDILELSKMFDPSATHSNGDAGGIDEGNFQANFNPVNLGATAFKTNDAKYIRVNTETGMMELSADGTTWYPYSGHTIKDKDGNVITQKKNIKFAQCNVTVSGNDIIIEGVGQGIGDMCKSQYDTNNNGQADKADDADALDGHAASYFQQKIESSGILKGDGSGGVSAAVAGTDYAAASHSHGAADIDAIPVSTTAPTAAWTGGGYKICKLSAEPATRYDGWIYLITTS